MCCFCSQLELAKLGIEICQNSCLCKLRQKQTFKTPFCDTIFMSREFFFIRTKILKQILHEMNYLVSLRSFENLIKEQTPANCDCM